MRRIHDHDHIAEVLVANPSLGHRAIAKLTGMSRSGVWYIARKRGIRQEAVSFHHAVPSAHFQQMENNNEESHDK